MRYSSSSIRSNRARLALTQLEDREVPSAVPTVSEQLFLERLNDARANPAAYGQQIGVDLSYIAPSAPLAFDTRIIEAARKHSQDMNDKRFFGHTGSNGSNPGQRMSAAGYPWRAWAESIAAGYTTPESALKALIIDAGVPSLGHRHHLLGYGSFSSHRDVGVGIVVGSGPYRYYYTIDSGYTSDTRPALTGVVYNDTNSNGKYDAGEGLGGVTLTVAGVGSVTTWSTGGYTFKLNPGTYLVTASGGGLASPVSQQVTVGSANYRLNVTPDRSGAKVTSGVFSDPASGSIQSLRLMFSEPIDPTTFTPADVSLTGPAGTIAVSSVTAVAGSNNTQFDVAFPAQSADGTYTAVVGPDIRNGSGLQMNQNGNGINGEIPGDRFTTSVTLPLPSAEFRFDFGTSVSPVAAGFEQVTQATAYSAARGYGWSAGVIDSHDRGVGTALTRDFNLTRDGTFLVDLADGTYDVRVTVGDTGGRAHDQMGVFLEGVQVDSVSTVPGQVVTRTYTVTVTDGQLTLRLRDLGGSDPNVFIEALEIIPI